MACCAAPVESKAVLMEKSPAVPEIRTAKQAPVPPQEALKLLAQGNQRFMAGKIQKKMSGGELRKALATDGQNPHTAVVACADSRVPIEILFDAQPGDLFVLRNAGNTCTHAEGSIVGSLEYSTGHLKTRLVLVLGHTKCGAIAGATKTMIANKENADSPGQSGDKEVSALEVLLQGLTPVAEQASKELPSNATADEIAAHAVKVNVFNTMDRLLEFSESLRERVRLREVQVHGAIYNLETGLVDFLGQSPNLGRLADSTDPPPEVAKRYGVEEEAPTQQDQTQLKAEGETAEPTKTQRWYHHLGVRPK